MTSQRPSVCFLTVFHFISVLFQYSAFDVSYNQANRKRLVLHRTVIHIQYPFPPALDITGLGTKALLDLQIAHQRKEAWLIILTSEPRSHPYCKKKQLPGPPVRQRLRPRPQVFCRATSSSSLLRTVAVNFSRIISTSATFLDYFT